MLVSEPRQDSSRQLSDREEDPDDRIQEIRLRDGIVCDFGRRRHEGFPNHPGLVFGKEGFEGGSAHPSPPGEDVSFVDFGVAGLHLRSPEHRDVDAQEAVGRTLTSLW